MSFVVFTYIHYLSHSFKNVGSDFFSLLWGIITIALVVCINGFTCISYHGSELLWHVFSSVTGVNVILSVVSFDTFHHVSILPVINTLSKTSQYG